MGIEEPRVLLVNIEAMSVLPVHPRRVHIVDMHGNYQEIVEPLKVRQVGGSSREASKVLNRFLGIVRAILANRKGKVVPKSIVSG